MSKLEKKNILIVSPEYWDGLHLSKHHYAIELANKGNNVCFLNPPGREYRVLLSNHENLCVMDYKGFWRGLHFMPRVFRRYHTASVLKKLEKLAGMKFDVLWSFDNSVFYEMDIFSNRLFSISHIVDLNMNARFERAARTANICLSSTKYILNRQSQYNKNSYFIDHGFSSVEEKDFPIPSHDGLKIGYAGSLDIPYLNWQVLERSFKRFDNCGFYFAGTCESSKERLNRENVFYVGKLSKPELISFLGKMDLLIICYKADGFKEQLANPHKILEYLGTGKPVVASYTANYDGSSLIFMSKRDAEWMNVFEGVVKEIHHFSSKELVEERKNYAHRRSYANQLNQIERLCEFS